MEIITAVHQWDTQFWDDEAGWHAVATTGRHEVSASAATYEEALDAIILAIKGEEFTDEEGNE